MDRTLQILTDYVMGMGQATLPEPQTDEAKRKLVDAVACALGGMPSAPATIARRLARRVQSDLPAGLFGSPHTTSPDWAAFANGVAIRQLDYNDTYPGGHPSDILGGVLGLASAVDADGPSVLRSMAAGYEVFCRCIDAVAIGSRGWDAGVFLAIAAAGASGRLLHLSPEQMAHAIALATVEGPTLRQTRAGELSMWKGCAGPSSARGGVYAALLAAEGMAGPAAPFEGRHGLFDQVTGPLDLALPDPSEGAPRLLDVNFKYFPIDFNSQAAVFAARDLRERVSVEEIEAIEVTTYHHAINETAGSPERWDPRTRETADHSLPYILATALREGTVGLEHFTPERVLDPSLRPLMAKVRVREDEEMTRLFPQQITWRAEVQTRGGRRYTAHIVNPRGHPLNPMSAEELEQKLRTMAGDILDSDTTTRLLAWLWEIDRAPGIRDLFSLLGTARVPD